MEYRIKPGIMFRNHGDFGYIADNSEYGYRRIDDHSPIAGEKYVSQSGAVMLSCLSRSFRPIDAIAKELDLIFEDVDHNTLKSDAVEFFNGLVALGFLEATVSPYCGDIHKKHLLQEAAMLPHAEFEEGCPLRSVHVEIAGRCNERCVHCYIPHAGKKGLIELAMFKRIVAEAREMNAINITISGGEPLLHPNLADFLDLSEKSDMSVNLLSNLVLANDNLIARISSNPLISIQTSLYSMSGNIHDSITGLSGSFSKTLNAILKILDAGIPLQISCPVMKQNKDSFIDVVHWGRDHKLVVAVEPMIFPVFDRSGSNLENRLSLQEYDEVISRQIDDGYGPMFRELALEKEEQEADSSICTICRHKICIAADGSVFPCVGWQNNVIGNLNSQSLREIWEDSAGVAHLRAITRSMFSKCVDCDDRGYCTVCMMANSNENKDGDIFHIGDFHCRAAHLKRMKAEA